MRIAYTTGSIIPSNAANSVQVLRMCESLGRLGHDVTLYGVYGGPGDVFEQYGLERTFRLERFQKPTLGRLGPAAYLAQVSAALWQGPKPDLVYSRGVRYVLAAAALGAPLVWEAHAMVRSRARRTTREALFALPQFKRVVSISGQLALDLLDQYPSLRADDVAVVHDAAAPFDPASMVPVTPWPGREGALQVGYVGGIYTGRGVDVLIEVARARPDYDLHVVGGEPEQIGLTRDVLPNVHWHGRVAPRDVPQYLASFDVLCAPYQRRVACIGTPKDLGGRGDISRWMSPLKVFEYLSTGRAIACSDLPVLREVLVDGENALLAEPGDVDDWVATLDRLTSRALRERLGRNARALFDAEYTWDKRAQAVLDAVEHGQSWREHRTPTGDAR